eukprot:UN30367
MQNILNIIIKVTGEEKEDDTQPIFVKKLVERLLEEKIINIEDVELFLAKSLTCGNTEAKLKFIDELIQPKEPALDAKTVRKLKDSISGIIREYFTSGELFEVQDQINSKVPKRYQFEVVKRVVSQAMDQDSKNRELASTFIGHVDSFSSPAVVRQGFTILLERLDDLVKDVPDATKMLSCFIARAIADEALAPSYLKEAHVITDGQTLPTRCLQKVHYLINMKFSTQRLERIWGPGRIRPVGELKSTISEMLKEFLSTPII